MKTLNFEQMEALQGGMSAAQQDCLVACGITIIGSLGMIGGFALAGPMGASAIFLAFGADFLAWGGTAYSCGRASGKF
jgi:hypothetical protein